jgi:hypothetical protein
MSVCVRTVSSHSLPAADTLQHDYRDQTDTYRTVGSLAPPASPMPYRTWTAGRAKAMPLIPVFMVYGWIDGRLY